MTWRQRSFSLSTFENNLIQAPWKFRRQRGTHVYRPSSPFYSIRKICSKNPFNFFFHTQWCMCVWYLCFSNSIISLFHFSFIDQSTQPPVREHVCLVVRETCVFARLCLCAFACTASGTHFVCVCVSVCVCGGGVSLRGVRERAWGRVIIHMCLYTSERERHSKESLGESDYSYVLVHIRERETFKHTLCFATSYGIIMWRCSALGNTQWV